jgi:2-amino-4-hydroxy-6-hydroxymethyldihydropteridine diphosphokinase
MIPNRKEHNQFPIYIAIGANLPHADGSSPLQICERAALAVAAIPGLGQAVRSRWFSSAPIPADATSPRYINGAIRLLGKITAEALLAALQAIERAEGRVRGTPNAPRTLDLDIIAMGDLVRSAPDPIVPHPRAHLRAFVLLPLRDLAPMWLHPETGVSISALIAGLPEQDIRAAE